MELTDAKYETLAEQIESILHDPAVAISEIKDKQIRRRLAAAGLRLSNSLEEPLDTLRRYGYVHFQSPMAFIGVETGMFAALAAEPRAFTNAELAEKTNVNPGFQKRLLRYYHALNMISQVDSDSYQANNVTKVLGNEYYGNILRFSQKIMAPASLKLPDLLQDKQYEDPTGHMPTAWNMAFHTDQHPFAWFAENPWAKELGLAHMKIQREGRPLCYDGLNLEERFCQGVTSSTVIFVDVGGSMGPQCIEFRQRYPNLLGRVILQDRPEVIEKAKVALVNFANIEAEAYDFFTPQNVKGARVYYIRNVLHDWPDDKCIEILRNVKAGLTGESVLLVDETALPERDVAPRAAQHDMEVLISLGAKERTQTEWRKLLEEAGLELQEAVRYDEEYEDYLMIARLK